MTTTPLGSRLPAPIPADALRPSISDLRSRIGALGALVLLLALPVTIAFDVVFPGHTEVVIHLLLATGTLLVGLSVFDFSTPKWLTRAAFAAACILTAI